MDDEFFGAAYKGSKNYTQQQVQTANATGFGAATDDYAERGIDLNEQLGKNKPATFFFRMRGNAMEGAGIFDNDILIVDRSLKANSGKIIVAALNGELMVRRLQQSMAKAFLMPENNRHKPIDLREYNDFVIWGVVVYSVHKV
jgi:DNA polymerase V